MAWEENSGPPFDVRVSGIPNVAKVSPSDCRRPDAPSLEEDTIGQFENRSTSTR